MKVRLEQTCKIISFVNFDEPLYQVSRMSNDASFTMQPFGVMLVWL